MVAEKSFLGVYIRPWLLNHVFWMYIYIHGIQSRKVHLYPEKWKSPVIGFALFLPTYEYQNTKSTW